MAATVQATTVCIVLPARQRRAVGAACLGELRRQDNQDGPLVSSGVEGDMHPEAGFLLQHVALSCLKGRSCVTYYLRCGA